MTQSTTERTGQSVHGMADNPAAKAAQGVSAPLERNLAQEPVNSTMRTMLLVGAGASIAGSLLMQMFNRKHEALFVGQWAPTLMIMALWYQVVKSRTYYSGAQDM